MTAGFTYVHGTHAAERERLSALNDLLNAASLRALSLRGGERVLDVGCGLGQLTRELARAAGAAGAVVGVDGSAEQLAEARRLAAEAGEADRVELRHGDAAHLPLRRGEWGSFDVVHARFLLEHVRDPLRVVEAMVRAARPGGRVVLQDDDHDLLRLWPACPGYSRLWRAYIDVFDEMGVQPHVGRHLVSLLHEAGARPVRNDCLFFGGCAGQSSFGALVGNFVGIVEGARAAILRKGRVDRAAFDAAILEFREWSRLPAAALWYTSAWAEGARRA